MALSRNPMAVPRSGCSRIFAIPSGGGTPFGSVVGLRAYPDWPTSAARHRRLIPRAVIVSMCGETLKTYLPPKTVKQNKSLVFATLLPLLTARCVSVPFTMLHVILANRALPPASFPMGIYCA
jgi:hypothetical protein